MPENLQALAVILTLATAIFAFAKAPACALASTAADFERRRKLWFGITLAAFLTYNFWIFVIVAAALLLSALPREPNKLAMFYFLLFAVPPFPVQIAGLGMIANLFTIDYIRLLALTVLLPAFLSLRRQPDSERFGRLLPDKIMACYIALNILLFLTVSSFTNTLRHGVFDAFIDIFLPYFVASRSLKNVQGFRDVLMSFAMGALVLSPIVAVEFAKHWLLYHSLMDALGVRWGYGGYMSRGGGVQASLRALGSTGHPISLGYLMSVAMGFFLYLRKLVPNTMVWTLGLVLLIMGLIAPVSRGPWVGAAAMLLLFTATGPNPGRRFVQLGLLGVILIPLVLISPFGERIIDYMPFIGTVDEENVIYRQRLLDISLQVMRQNLFFGSSDFIDSPALQEMMQGEGIIDIVNSYLAVGMARGLVGLSLFSGFFIAVAVSIYSGMRSIADRNSELYLLGRVLLATLIGILIIIFTVSSITIIPVIYWTVAGLGVAYARMLASARRETSSLESATPARSQSAAVPRRR